MLYKIAKAILFLMFNTVYNIEVTGLNNIPGTGAAIVCANHISFADPIAIAIFIKRQLHFIAKKELFAGAFLNFIFKGIGAIPVDRKNVGLSSFKDSIRVLKDGGIIGIFAQSTRKASVDEKDAKSGVALFAVKSGAPVVPVGVSGSYRLFTKVTVNIGEPMDFGAYKDKRLRTPELNEITEDIMKRIKDLAGE